MCRRGDDFTLGGCKSLSRRGKPGGEEEKAVLFQ
jgi:hypothetical protein